MPLSPAMANVAYGGRMRSCATEAAAQVNAAKLQITFKSFMMLLQRVVTSNNTLQCNEELQFTLER
eukprot:13648-Heterococcus_DN1.PRE.1